MPRMPLLTWISLAFLAVALVGSIAVAVSRGLRAWRIFRRFSRTASSAIGALLHTGAEVDASAALARLPRSQAELAVIQAAANEAKLSLLAFWGFVPRK